MCFIVAYADWINSGTVYRRAAITAAGHVPAPVGLDRVLAVPFRSIEHLDGYFQQGASRTGVNLMNVAFFGCHFAGQLDGVRVAAAVKDTARAGVALVPTQFLLETLLGPVPGEQLSRTTAGIGYVTPATVAAWTVERTQTMARADFSRASDG